MITWDDVKDRVVVERVGDCDLITYPVHSKGICNISYKRKKYNLRKLYFEQYAKKIENDEMLFTTCGNTNCLNLDHINCIKTNVPKPATPHKTIVDRINYRVEGDCHIVTSHTLTGPAVRKYYEHVVGKIETLEYLWHTCGRHDCCNLDHIEKLKKGDMSPRMFQSRVDYYVAPNGCWIYKGATNYEGYATIGYLGTKMLLHKYSYGCHKGAIPKGMQVMHSCDNPSCCNPDHLSLGTRQENTQDMIDKARACTVGRKTMLTEDDVRDIRNSSMSSYQLAAIYPVTPTHIRRIKNGSRR